MSIRLETLLAPTISGLGFELVELEVTPAKTLRVFIDKDPVVTIADCEYVSNHLSKLLVVENVDYNRLEVSSPGLERPLKKITDFVRFQGRVAKIKTLSPINGQKVVQGVIAAVDGQTVTINLEDEQVVEIDFADISRARLIFEWKRTTKIDKRKRS